MYNHPGKSLSQGGPSSNVSFDLDIGYAPIWPSLKSFGRVVAVTRRLFHLRPIDVRSARAFRLFILFRRKLNDEGGQAGGEIPECSSFRRNNSSHLVFRRITYEYQVCQSIDTAQLCAWIIKSRGGILHTMNFLSLIFRKRDVKGKSSKLEVSREYLRLEY